MADEPLRCAVVIRLYRAEKCFGPGVVQLLEIVDEVRSLRAAAGCMGMAYSKAFKIVHRAQEQLGVRLLDSQTGGHGGGGASLTDDARALIDAYRAMEREIKHNAQALFQKHFARYL